MNTVQAIATDKNGRSVRALQICCTNCNGAHFRIFLVGDEKHQHLQCTDCQESFCDGSCVRMTSR